MKHQTFINQGAFTVEAHTQQKKGLNNSESKKDIITNPLINGTLIITAKGPPTSLNSDTFGMDTSWPKMMFECCTRIHTYDLRPSLLIYASKTRI